MLEVSLYRIAHPIESASFWLSGVWDNIVAGILGPGAVFTLTVIMVCIMLWQLGLDTAPRLAYWTGVIYLGLVVITSV